LIEQQQPPLSWIEKNQKYLAQSIDQVKALLERYLQLQTGQKTTQDNSRETEGFVPEWDDPYHPPSLESLCNLFGLTPFERSLLLLCAGIEVADMGRLLSREQGGLHNAAYPTFSLALAILPQPHWSALTPASPLRQFRLIELLHDGTPIPLVSSPLRIEERVLHYLTGISYLEPSLRGLIRAVRDVWGSIPLVPSHQRLAEEILASFDVYSDNKRSSKPAIQLLGTDAESKVMIAHNVCKALGMNLYQLPGELIQTRAPADIESFVQIWSRETLLLNAGLYISGEDVPGDEIAFRKTVARLIDDIPGPIFLGTRERWSTSAIGSKHIIVSLDVKKPQKSEQLQLWNSCLDEKMLADLKDGKTLEKLVNQFDFNASAIMSACAEAHMFDQKDTRTNNFGLSERLWYTSLRISRPKIGELAQQIFSRAHMDDLVLPEHEKVMLRDIVVHVSHKTKVFDEWGFGSSSNRGSGVTALFFGASGTGKTMAAEVLANELHLDLFRIDLSTVVSKYVGETEKNLRRVFDAAEDGGAILFFDEADALFGKRTEVHDSHDRLANIEIDYILMRMERYHGSLAILATNMKNSIDSAFLRRIRFTVNFPFPDEKSREQIWRRVFPPSAPLDGINFYHLARLNISGGNIRNIALNAAFLAAEEGAPIGMKHMKRAAQIEYTKLERPLTEAELNW
jgi:AAA+ superfamily predicted ATPase